MALAALPDVPGFHALSPLGYGPTSTIYGAQSHQLGRWVSLTVYSASLPDERTQKKFRRAFDVARRLGTHPSATTMLDCGVTADRHPYVVAEIYERGTLEGRAQSRPLPVDEVLRLGVALAGALETAHRAEVMHGGVHPARVLLAADGEPALADLGLVSLVERGGLAALTGPLSLSYHASPEVLEGEAVSNASDVYSLASTLYTALTGRPPYQRDDDDTAASLLLRMLQHDVPPIERPDVPPSLQEALRRALSCSPRDRPGRALAFARDLQECQKELGLPVSEPVVLDVAASLGLARIDGDDDHPPLGAPPSTAPGSSSVFGSAGAPGNAASVFPTPAPEAGRFESSPGVGAGHGVAAAGADAPRLEPPVLPPLPSPAAAPAAAPLQQADPTVSGLVSPAQAAAAAATPAPEVSPSPTSNGHGPVQRVFIPYPAPEPQDPLHRQDGGAGAEGASPDATAAAPALGAPAMAPAIPEAPPVEPEPPVRAPLDLAPELPARTELPPSLADDPSERRRNPAAWRTIPVGDENDDPAKGAPAWPGPAQASPAPTEAKVDPDPFVWPSDLSQAGNPSPAAEGPAGPPGASIWPSDINQPGDESPAGPEGSPPPSIWSTSFEAPPAPPGAPLPPPAPEPTPESTGSRDFDPGGYVWPPDVSTGLTGRSFDNDRRGGGSANDLGLPPIGQAPLNRAPEDEKAQTSWPPAIGSVEPEPDDFVWPNDLDRSGGAHEAPGGHPGAHADAHADAESGSSGVGWSNRREAASSGADMNSWPYVADRPTRNGETAAAASPAPAGPKEPAVTSVAPTATPFAARDQRDHRDRHDATEAIPGGAMRAGVAAAMPALDTDDEEAALAPAPAESSPAGRTGGRTAGSVPQADGGFTRALPVIAVGVIVAVLAVGVAWVVMFGEDPAEQGRTGNSSTSAAPSTDNLSNDAGSSESVMAVENANGVQLDWGGTEGPQVVVVLSESAAPRALEAKTGSALLVPASSLSPQDGYCFAVVPETEPAPAPAELASGLADSALATESCIRGATAQSVRRS
jgi:serine/threonine protein kinase